MLLRSKINVKCINNCFYNLNLLTISKGIEPVHKDAIKCNVQEGSIYYSKMQFIEISRFYN